MTDQSELDKKYFVDNESYNCPFCNRNNVVYAIIKQFVFDWSKEKRCFAYITECSSCDKQSLHLSFEPITNNSKTYLYRGQSYMRFKNDIDIDSFLFFSQPTSFFVIDERIPRVLRELITEAEGCLKMNFLTGASACTRKAIYELLVFEKIDGNEYQERIKALKQKYPNTDPTLFDILAHIQDMVSDKIHEQSWDKWNSPNLKLITETLKTVLYDIYVIPQIKKERSVAIQQLQEKLLNDKKQK